MNQQATEQEKPTEALNQAQENQDPQGFEMEAGTEEEGEDRQPETPAAETPETQAAPAESADKKQETPGKTINQQAVQKKIDKAIREKHEERRKREALEAQLEQANKRLAAEKNEQIIIPDMPDAFDPDFNAKVAARDAALQKAAQQQAQMDIERQNQERLLREKADVDRKRINGYVETMFETAKNLGISQDDLKQADDTVAMFIKDPGLATYILSQKDAPLIINHLATNISELESISKMNPIDAAAHIATSVIPAAKNYKPAIPTTPDPVEIPAGKAKSNTESPYLNGVEFE